jgi:hypothetical protein
MCHSVNAQLTSLFHELPEQVRDTRLLETTPDRDQSLDEETENLDQSESLKRTEPMWLLSGKFQGDIDGIDPAMIKKLVWL